MKIIRNENLKFYGIVLQNLTEYDIICIAKEAIENEK